MVDQLSFLWTIGHLEGFQIYQPQDQGKDLCFQSLLRYLHTHLRLDSMDIHAFQPNYLNFVHQKLLVVHCYTLSNRCHQADSRKDHLIPLWLSMQYHNQDKRQMLKNWCPYSHKDCYISVCNSVFVVIDRPVLYHKKKNRWKQLKTLWLCIDFGSMRMIDSWVTSIRWILTSRRVSILTKWSKFYSQNQMWYTM